MFPSQSAEHVQLDQVVEGEAMSKPIGNVDERRRCARAAAARRVSVAERPVPDRVFRGSADSARR